MAPKKKKTQMKKVERGFATTSIPKKVAPQPIVEPEPDVVDPEPAKENTESKPSVDSGAQLDERELRLQDIVDRFQDRNEKEVLRAVKAIEYDRRLSNTWSTIELEESIQNEIFQLLDKTESCDVPWNQTIGKDPDKPLEQMGVLFGILRRLGFSEDLVLESIAASSKIDFDESVDRLYRRCEPEDLEFDKSQGTPKGSAAIPGVSVLAPAVQSITSPSPEPPQKNRNERKDLKSSSATRTKGVTPVPTLAIELDDDPNIAYAQVKLEILKLTEGSRTPSNDPLVASLRSRLDLVKKEYLFREKFAEAEFQGKRKEWLSSSSRTQLRGEHLSAFSEPQATENRTHTPTREDSPASADTIDVFDKVDDDESDIGLLNILEPMPSEITTPTGSVINVRNLSMPKTWTNRTPKNLLLEISTYLDRRAAATFKEISGGSRAKRAAVTVRWSNGMQSEWEMTDVACHDLSQAEYYTQASYKTLPPSFRDLWEELEAKRKMEEATTNREVWSKLSDLLQVKNSTGGMDAKSIKKTEVLKPSPLQSREIVVSSSGAIADYERMQASTSYQDMMLQRNALPIASFRHEIIEAINNSRVIVLSGETGCGKSTQLPSFILEDQLSCGQHCKIVVTEPRRISAISLAQRVSQELGEPSGAVGTSSSLVGYTIRLESHTSKRTRLNFVTNGIALRMLESGSGKEGQGTAFDDITHIIIDEVHERNIDSDFLLIVLKSLLNLRDNLKVILMSATLDADKISDFFGGCPIISVPGRTYPVDVRYLEDAIEFAKYIITPSSVYARQDTAKASLTHEWNEDVVKDVDDETPSDNDKEAGSVSLSRYSSQTRQTFKLLDEYVIPYELIMRLLEVVCFEDPNSFEMSHAFLVFLPGLAEIRRLNDLLAEHPRFGSDEFVVYPLHSTIPSDGQGVVFRVPPQGVRKIVLATNIAETGITIPDITCVIDTGKHKEMRYDEKRQISRLIQTFIAKSNATQRKGRAGRVRSGLCFHLFSGARYAKMAEHPLPEMLRLSLSDLALRIKIMKVQLGTSILDVLSRALDPPSTTNIQRAITALVDVKALTVSEDITPMGRLLSKLPMDVHLGKFLLVAALFKCLDPALTIAATLNSKSPFVAPFGQEREAEKAKANFASGSSDFLTIHNAFASFRRASANPDFIHRFCRENFLNYQTLQQIEEIRQQLLGYLIESSFIKVDTGFTQEFSRARYSRQRTTRFVTIPSEYDANSTLGNNNMALLNAALVAGLFPKVLSVDSSSSSNGRTMKTLTNNQAAFFHPSSVNFRRRPGDLGASYLTFFTIVHSKRLYAWETAPVEDLAIIQLCGEAEFKLISNTIDIDRKIKYRVAPKTNVALKHLRGHLLEILALQFEGKELSDTQMAWNVLAMKVLGKVNSLQV